MHEVIQVAAEPAISTSAPMLVYDGECGFCSRSVQFILRHEQRHDLLFVPRESALGKELRRNFRLEAVESMLWVCDGEVAIESGAVLRAANYLGGFWAVLAAVGSVVPAPIRNWVYRLIARNRRRLSSAAKTCYVPTAEQRTRFLG
jgi:predicted DCC family thiol-disulfide oxidoreductase YuxK